MIICIGAQNYEINVGHVLDGFSADIFPVELQKLKRMMMKKKVIEKDFSLKK